MPRLFYRGLHEINICRLLEGKEGILKGESCSGRSHDRLFLIRTKERRIMKEKLWIFLNQFSFTGIDVIIVLSAQNVWAFFKFPFDFES